MSQQQPTPSKNIEIVTNQVKKGTQPSIIALIANQLDRAEEAAARIVKEGSVVRDMKGSVIAHPAIAIEIAATKTAAEMLLKARF